VRQQPAHLVSAVMYPSCSFISKAAGRSGYLTHFVRGSSGEAPMPAKTAHRHGALSDTTTSGSKLLLNWQNPSSRPPSLTGIDHENVSLRQMLATSLF
jgi:hypothetical protein